MIKNNTRLCLLIRYLCLSFISIVNANPGDLDTTFGTSGLSLTPISSNDFITTGIVSNYLDEIVLAGGTKTFENDILIARYTSNGVLDTTFNSTGILAVKFGSASLANGVAVQLDDKILVSGFSTSSQTGFLVARYNTNGSADTSFNGTGSNTTIINDGSDANAIALQSNGDIILAGASVNGVPHFTLARYDPYGVLDTTFGSSGITITPINIMSSIFKIAVDSYDDSIIAVGYSYIGTENHITIARYHANGTLDTSFGSSGIITQQIGTESKAYYVLIQPDRNIVVAGYAVESNINESILIRYTPSGALDTTFNGTGIVKTTCQYGSKYFALTIQGDDKLIAAGYCIGGLSNLTVVARYTTAGALDASFGSGGITTTSVGSDAFYSDVEVQSTGKIITVGMSDGTILLSRYLAA